MFKRANKITALLVAAASIMSVVPAMADDSTSTARLGSKDGHITNAIAYKDGKYVYQGYKSDDDTDSIYYNGGDKDKELDDSNDNNISDSTLNAAYGDKYAFTNDGSDQYLVDLTSGDVTDDTTPSDDVDTAATKLQTKLNKADRYKKDHDVIVEAVANLETGIDSGDQNNDDKLYTIPGNKFGDSWYSYSVQPFSSDADSYKGKDGNLYGFTDGSGKYIDASYTANIYAYSTKEGKTVKIENFSNNYDDKDSDSELLATLVRQPVALTQDKDYIYALVTVAVTDTNANAKATDATTTATAADLGVQNSTETTTDASGKTVTTNKTGVTTVRTYLQKISKAQGEQKDDAYLPKTVESYEVGNTNGNEYDCGDASDAYDAIQAALSDAGRNTDLTQLTQQDVKAYGDETTGYDNIARPLFTVDKDGNLIAIKATSDKVDAVTLKFKKDKVKFKSAGLPNKESDKFNIDNKVDAYFVEKDSDDSVDLNGGNDVKPFESYDVDVDGNVWLIADGKIYEYKAGGDFTKVYSCDSALDAISVYDSNSMIAWENNGDIYTTINEGKAETSSEDGTTTGAVTAQTGWVQLADGTWNLYDATGNKVVNNWAIVGGTWYYLKADGVMATGWTNVGGTWYYLNASGAMQTGWFNDNGTWYYLQSSGAMATGWLNDNGTWYYLNASGAMLANTTVDGYVLGASGAWIQ